jgi:hypothetical protein
MMDMWVLNLQYSIKSSYEGFIGDIELWCALNPTTAALIKASIVAAIIYYGWGKLPQLSRRVAKVIIALGALVVLYNDPALFHELIIFGVIIIFAVVTYVVIAFIVHWTQARLRA